jgi:hypothetical protein
MELNTKTQILGFAGIAAVISVLAGVKLIADVVTKDQVTPQLCQVCETVAADGSSHSSLVLCGDEKLNAAVDSRIIKCSTPKITKDKPLADYTCACSPITAPGNCLLDGKPAPLETTLPSGRWAGACIKKRCLEATEMIIAQGDNYSMPAECLLPRPTPLPPDAYMRVLR